MLNKYSKDYPLRVELKSHTQTNQEVNTSKNKNILLFINRFKEFYYKSSQLAQDEG